MARAQNWAAMEGGPLARPPAFSIFCPDSISDSWAAKLGRLGVRLRGIAFESVRFSVWLCGGVPH